MRRRNLTEYEKELIFEKWQDRTPTKVIALEMGAILCLHLFSSKEA
jgi:hypothetical protein